MDRAFRKGRCHDNPISDFDFAVRDFFKHKSKMTGHCCVFKFLRRSVGGKHLMRFQSENAVVKFHFSFIEAISFIVSFRFISDCDLNSPKNVNI